MSLSPPCLGELGLSLPSPGGLGWQLYAPCILKLPAFLVGKTRVYLKKRIHLLNGAGRIDTLGRDELRENPGRSMDLKVTSSCGFPELAITGDDDSLLNSSMVEH